MGSLSHTVTLVVLMVYGVRGVVFREWRTYVPFYSPPAPRNHYVQYYSYYTPQLPSVYGSGGGFAQQIVPLQNELLKNGMGPNQFRIASPDRNGAILTEGTSQTAYGTQSGTGAIRAGAYGVQKTGTGTYGVQQIGIGGYDAGQTGTGTYGVQQTGAAFSQSGYGSAQAMNGAAQTGALPATAGIVAAQTGNGATQTVLLSPQTGYGAQQTVNGAAPTGNIVAQTGSVLAQSGPVVAQTGTVIAQTGNVGAQTGNIVAQNVNGVAQNGNLAVETGNGSIQTGAVTVTRVTPSGGDIWKGYTMYQQTQYPDLLQKVTTALKSNGPELTASQINFAGYKTVGSEAATGPGVVSLVNFGDQSNHNCYAYYVEPTGKTPSIPKDSIVCAT